MIQVEYHKSLYLPELDLWLDSRSVKERGFVSHSHYDHYAKHKEVISSSVNAQLMMSRFKIAEKRIVARDYEVPWEEDGFRFELLPAGHIFGSTMLHLTRLSDGATLLYTGDYKMRKGLAAEEVKLKPADLFITETTFGLPKFNFPPAEDVYREIVEFVRGALKEGAVPVLYGYSLGKAQEAVALMEQNEIPVIQHKTVAKMTEACRRAGLSLQPAIVLDGEVPEGAVLICSPKFGRSTTMRRLENKRTAMLSGWAMNSSAIYRYKTDAAFPLSDHADYDGLMEAVERVQPKQVLTLHGYAKEFAADLRAQGIEAWSVFGNDQLELQF